LAAFCLFCFACFLFTLICLLCNWVIQSDPQTHTHRDTQHITAVVERDHSRHSHESRHSTATAVVTQSSLTPQLQHCQHSVVTIVVTPQSAHWSHYHHSQRTGLIITAVSASSLSLPLHAVITVIRV
jgi:hypothetical protein